MPLAEKSACTPRTYEVQRSGAKGALESWIASKGNPLAERAGGWPIHGWESSLASACPRQGSVCGWQNKAYLLVRGSGPRWRASRRPCSSRVVHFLVPQSCTSTLTFRTGMIQLRSRGSPTSASQLLPPPCAMVTVEDHELDAASP